MYSYVQVMQVQLDTVCVYVLLTQTVSTFVWVKHNQYCWFKQVMNYAFILAAHAMFDWTLLWDLREESDRWCSMNMEGNVKPGMKISPGHFIGPLSPEYLKCFVSFQRRTRRDWNHRNCHSTGLSALSIQVNILLWAFWVLCRGVNVVILNAECGSWSVSILTWKGIFFMYIL